MNTTTSPPTATASATATATAASAAVDPASVARRIGVDAPGHGARARLRRLAPLLAVALLLVAAAAGWWWLRSAPVPVSYVAQPATRGAMVVRVSATGNLQPTTQVDVGSELSGTIEQVLVEDNDRVKKGQPLARLDTAKLEDQVVRSEAALASARATLAMDRAATREARGNLDRLRDAWDRSGGKVPSKADLATAEAAVDKSVAAEAGAQAAVGQAEATLRSDRTNLSKAVIRSPIDGVVLLRKVEPGQTVAASLQAPVLFTLAQGLTQMELQVQVDEADVGQVRDGQRATFEVDAWPDRSWPATIRRVRYGSDVTNNVVTYLAVLDVANEDLSLRPGMTATARITTLRHDDALLVPNAALRWAPAGAAGGADVAASAASGSSVTSLLMPRLPRGAGKQVSVHARGGRQTVWKLVDGRPQAVEITAGATDGRQTEVLSGALQAGDRVVVESVEGRR